jgi:hypothetical protein
MPYSTLTAQTLTYAERQPGDYALSTLTFANPANYIRIRPGAVRKDGIHTLGFTRVLEKDVTVGDDVVRKSASIIVNILQPGDGSFTAAELDSLMADLNEVITVARLDEVAQGKY